jgi:N-acetylated-alpha-linked acidic dipeptidase
MKRQVVLVLAIALVVCMSLTAISPTTAAKQGKSVLTEEELAMAAAVGDGSYAMGVDQFLSYDPSVNCIVDDQGRGCWRPAGSEADHAAAEWVQGEMERIGLQNVKMEPFPVDAFTVNAQAYVQIAGESGTMLGAVPSGLPGTVQNPKHDPDGGITRPMVYVGLGTSSDYVGKDVKGKIVLCDVYSEEMYWCNMPHMQATLEGADGIIIHWLEYQQGPGYVTTHDSESITWGIPMITVSHIDFARLKALSLADPTAEVKMWADCTVTPGGVSYNVVGYIPGTDHPEQLIIHGAIFDKHWYGFNHHVSDVSAMMQSAKAIIDSGYKPSCTLVYVAIGAEEYGKADTLNAWAIGSYFTAHVDHPDWGGTTRAHVEFGGSLLGDYTVSLGGNPGTYPWRVNVISAINEYFTNHEPWSAYYVPASTSVGGLPGTWVDSWNYGTSGMETMSVSSRGSKLYAGMYHCQNDTGIVSTEALAMNAIAGGINTIMLDRAALVPYAFSQWADFIKNTIDQNAWSQAGVSKATVNAELTQLKDLGSSLWNIIKKGGSSENADEVNALMMQATKQIFSLIINGGWGDESMLRHEHYQVDTVQLKATIDGLKKGDVNALWNLLDVYCGYYAINVDREVYEHFIIECTSPDYIQGRTWGSDGLEAHYTDIYDELYSLLDKRASGDTDFSWEISSLTAKYNVAVQNLQDSADFLGTTLSNANGMLESALELLS